MMDVYEALQALEEAVRRSLDGAKTKGARAFEAGQFELAKQAADEGKTIEAFVEEVARIMRRWENLQSVTQGPDHPIDAVSSAPTGQPGEDLTDPETLVQPILHLLETMGGTAQRNDVIDRLEAFVLEEFSSNGEGAPQALPPGWEEVLIGAQKIMVKRGLLHARPQRGIWQITPQGRLLLFEKQ